MCCASVREAQERPMPPRRFITRNAKAGISFRASLRSVWRKHSATSGQAATVLLEEVDRLPAEAQEELVGLLRSGLAAVRAIATTDRQVAELVAEAQFSRELASLLSTITIELPPLAERSDDVPLLAQAFLED